jgi:glutathione synthase/RimK-type ligase-like ATP-grasp enzyme
MRGPVLITGARAPVALDLARAFAAAGEKVHLADSVTPWAARWSSGAWPIHRLPSPRFAFPAFRAALATWVAHHRPRLIVPTCEEIFYVAAAAEADGYADRVFAPPLETLRTLHSKFLFPAFARSLGIEAPETIRIESRYDLAALPADIVLKPEYSRFAAATLIRPSAAALAELDPTRERPWVAQPFVEGEEICLWAAVRDGEIRALAAYRPTWRHGRSAAYAFETVHAPAAEDAARRIAAATGMTGHLAFDFILDASGAAVPIECNPRAVSGIHLFDAAPALAHAILGDGIAKPAPGLRYLSPAMALLGIGPALGGRWRDYVADWRRGADVLARPGDRLPVLGSLADAARFALLGLSRLRGPTGATTDDIEWNGGPIA